MDNFKKGKIVSKSNTIIGAVIGDVIGSAYEWNKVKTTEFALFTAKSDFTDDTVLTIAVDLQLVLQAYSGHSVLRYGISFIMALSLLILFKP